MELRKMPANAIPDKFDYIFIYEKNGEKKEFKVSALPDSTWKFVDRKQTLVKKGSNNIPLINDFSLGLNGVDSTEAILSQPGEYYLFFVNDLQKGTNAWSTAFVDLWQKAKDQSRKLYIVTAQPDVANQYFNQLNNFNVPVLTCDGTAIKTAARVVPTVYLMSGPVVKDKRSWRDISKLK
jgi:hypothetical protein